MPFPTFYKNGSPISCLGPFWSNAVKGDPFCFFQLPATASPTDVYTFAAASGWATTSAGSATSYYGGLTPNYIGTFEPALYGDTPIHLSADHTTNGLQAAFDVGMSNNTSNNNPRLDVRELVQARNLDRRRGHDRG